MTNASHSDTEIGVTIEDRLLLRKAEIRRCPDCRPMGGCAFGCVKTNEARLNPEIAPVGIGVIGAAYAAAIHSCTCPLWGQKLILGRCSQYACFGPRSGHSSK